MRFSDNLIKRISNSGVIAVLVIEDVHSAVPVAKALIAGGISAIELTLRTKVAFDCLKIIKAEVPNLTIGAGTVLTCQQVYEISEIGVDFGVSPGFNPKIIERAQENSLPFAPGIMTPSEIEGAIQLGCTIMKFFPAESSGGIKHLNSMKAPYEHRGVKFIPLGGIDIDNMKNYLLEDNIIAVGGSWIAKPTTIKNKLWDEIKSNALVAKNIVEKLRSDRKTCV